jgi:hypothetical protein
MYQEKSGNPGWDAEENICIVFHHFFSPIFSAARVARWYKYLQTKTSNLGKLRRVLQWKMLVFLWTGGLFCGYLV